MIRYPADYPAGRVTVVPSWSNALQVLNEGHCFVGRHLMRLMHTQHQQQLYPQTFRLACKAGNHKYCS